MKNVKINEHNSTIQVYVFGTTEVVCETLLSHIIPCSTIPIQIRELDSLSLNVSAPTYKLIIK